MGVAGETGAAGTDWSGLHVLADDDPRWKHDPVALGAAACAGGAAVVQLRAKHTSDSQVLAWGEALRAMTRDAGLRFVVNDRFDLAAALDADAVHLGQGDLPPGRVPAAFRARLAIGRSTHGLEQIEAARTEDVDYLAFGPVFDTHSKRSEHDARGVAALRAAAACAAPRPLVAIGGIDAPRVAALREAGATGVAVIAAVAGADDPLSAVRELVHAWRGA